MPRTQPATVSRTASAMLALLTRVTLLLVLFSGWQAQAAAPVAGTLITNQASSTYVPAGRDAPERVTSNRVGVPVGAAEALSLATDLSVVRPAGARVVLAHVLTNTGNVASHYNFSLRTPSGQDFELLGLELVHDLNANGLVDAAEPRLALGASALQLQPGRTASLLVIGQMPAVAAGLLSRIELAASIDSGTARAVNTDTIRTDGEAVVVLTKTTDQASYAIPGATINFTIVAANTGAAAAAPAATAAPSGAPLTVDGQPATLFLLRDLLPAAMAYVPGSLATDMPGAIRLFRLAGDQPFQYRSTGDDSRAIEVAVGSASFLLQPNAVIDLRLSAKVREEAAGTLSNVADAYFRSGKTETMAASNPLRLTVPAVSDRIGVAKRAEPAVYETAASGVALGTARLRLTFVISSYSDTALRNVQLRDLLEGDTRFGTYTTSTTPGVGQYTVLADGVRVGPVQAGTEVRIDTAFDGTAARANLLAAGAALPARSSVEVSVELRVNVQQRILSFPNTATVSALHPAAGTLSDDSVHGADPDANRDGDPTNDASPTPILLSLPALEVKKVSAKPVRVDAATWDLAFAVTITNSSNAAAQHVQVADNLYCAFRTWQSPVPVRSWTLVGRPSVDKGLLKPNEAYTGGSKCNLQDGGTDPGMSTQLDAQLVDGTMHLDPGAAETIHYTIRVVLQAEVHATDRSFTNRAYAAITDRADITQARIFSMSDSAVVVTPLDPSGVVYNAVTRAPVAGAEARLVRRTCTPATGGITADQLVAIEGVTYQYRADGSVSMKTGADGKYAFFLKSPPVTATCEYALTVEPPSPDLSWPSQLIPPTVGPAPGGPAQAQDVAPSGTLPTTYYLTFRLGPNLPDVTNNHVPLDARQDVQGGMLLEKKGDRSVVEIGNSLEYALKLKNTSAAPLTGFVVEDRFPAGFRYVRGSSRKDGKAIADPVIEGGVVRWTFADTTLQANEMFSVQYRAQSGIATRLGEAVNRAQVRSGTRSSNLAEHRVRVEGGVFSDDGFLIGKVFLSCSDKGIQEAGDVGIPGVRVLMEDGTSAITDSEGKYSLYGLRPVTHVLRLDETTLPAGARLVAIDNRNSGSANSRFVDLKKGELHRGNFMVHCDTPGVREDVQRRRTLAAQQAETEGSAVARARLEVQDGPALPLEQVRRRDATGELTPSGIGRAQVAPGSAAVFRPVATPEAATAAVGSDRPAPQPRIELEAQLGDADATLAFVGHQDGDTLPTAVTNIRVKGRMGATLRLQVNGTEQPASRVGKRARLAERQLEAWEYIGVELRAGDNQLVLSEVDPFGNVRGSQTLRLVAPGKMGRIELQVPATAVADGMTPATVQVQILDDRGVPVTARTPVTLEVDNGRWETRDLNPDEPGTQVFVEGGQAEFALVPPAEPRDALVRASSGVLRHEARIAYVPELRPMIGAGIVEGVLDLRRKGPFAIGQASVDAFEQTLRAISRGGDRTTGRAAFYLKGTVKGEYLLTAAFDSDKPVRERLFRDIQPDKYYPIYGDASGKSFDAQSTRRLYVRVDHHKSWLLFGDFVTVGDADVRKLSQYNRAGSGLKLHHENETVSANAYASSDSLTQMIEEIPANGTSGPYPLTRASDVREDSERVEIVVRDRRQPAVILQVIPLTRLSDYVLEPVSRQIRFAAPVSSLDENLNPRSIRVTYESDGGGPKFWVAGADAQVKISENLQLGASIAQDNNPANPVTLAGTTAVVRMGPDSVVTAEVARSQTGEFGTGYAERLEWTHGTDKLKLRAQATHTDEHFDNATAGVGKGRTEATLDARYQLTDKTSLRVEGIHSKDATTDTGNTGVLASISTRLTDDVRAEVGMRAARETAAAASTTGAASGTTSHDLLTARGRLSARVPGLQNAEAYVEGEQDVRDSGRRMVAVGGDTMLGEKTKLYGRYELISSLGNPFALNASQQNNTGVVGIESSVLKDTRLFNELRLRDAISGRELQAASGARSSWQVSETLRVNGGLETTKAFSGVPGNDATAVTGSVEYAATADLRMSASLELRKADAGNSVASTMAVAYKIDSDWSMLARSAYSLQKNRASDTRNLQTRQQIGLAWRQVASDDVNALARYEHVLKEVAGGTAPQREQSHTLSAHVNYQPRAGTIATGRYAYKWGEEYLGGIVSGFNGHLVQGRITQDLTKRIDLSLQAAALMSPGAESRTSLGAEVGVQAYQNLWVALGYNVTGFRGDQLGRGDFLQRGAYLRVRFKFAEDLLQ